MSPTALHSRRSVLAALVTSAVLPLAAHAQKPASDWPSKPITIIVPSAAGGAADYIGRTFAHFLTENLPNSTVLVDNRAGAAGIVGTLAAKAAAPDGYTFLISTNSTHAANVSMFKNLRYDPIKDFVQVGMFGTSSAILIVRSDSPYKTLPQFIAYARANPGKLNYGYYSSASQVPPELLRSREQLDFVGASYKTGSQIFTDVLGGQLDFVFIDTLSAAPALQNDRLRALAVSSPRAMPSFPNVPPVSATVPGYEMQGWFGLSAPAGTPREVVDQMSALVRKATENPAVRRGLEERGLGVRAVIGADFDRFVKEDIVRWADWVKVAKLEVQ